MEFSTLQSRLATFERPSKRSKLGWPHKAPTPEDLAQAGFYHKPSSASNDNTVCYLCDRQLDGWEPDDDPIQEHLTHSGSCGWAILMSAGQDEHFDVNKMEDPTSDYFADARRATFAIGWPHEAKRAWRCKTEKMVEAGWHYSPTADGDDYVSCIYCKLALDGWDPKDDPFHEHHRRSPNCPFFHFAGTTAPSKRPKAKKGRASRASRTSKASTRLSTQSNTTMLSEAPSASDIPELEESIDTSTMSVISTMSMASTATAKGKRKGAGGRAKTAKSKRAKMTRSTRAKKDEPEPEPEPEPMEQAEVALEAEPAQISTQSEGVEVEVERQTQIQTQEQSLPSPAPSPPPEVAYPAISNSPGVPHEPRHLSPVGAPPQPSPTPVKTRARTSASGTRTATSGTATKFQAPPARSPTPTSPSPASDIENAPPSTRPASVRPPAPAPTPDQQTNTSPSPPSPAMAKWTPVDLELVFQATSPQRAPADLALALTGATLTTEERAMTVQEWIENIAAQAEEGLRAEAERVVSVFEREGARAMGVLEAIKCI